MTQRYRPFCCKPETAQLQNNQNCHALLCNESNLDLIHLLKHIMYLDSYSH